jgi:NAD(P)-dependent dehydrogenase (short-subunit alcohol dehydrogenase family)
VAAVASVEPLLCALPMPGHASAFWTSMKKLLKQWLPESAQMEAMPRLMFATSPHSRACAAVPQMMSNGGGIILNMASIAGTSGLADRFAYSMSKGAVVAMTYSVAKDYLTYKIRCNCISPARVHTPFVDGYLHRTYPGREKEMFEKLEKSQPIGRMGKPEEIAALALYLCSEEASFITGSDIPIDGGFQTLRG